MRGPVGVADEFVQHHARATGKLKAGAVDEAKSNPAVGCGLDDVALANRFANPGLNGNAARTRQGAGTDRRLNVADDLGSIRRASCLGVLNMPCQRVDKIAGEVSAIGRRKRSALFAPEVILQDQFVVVLGKNQVDAGSLKISVEKQTRVGMRTHAIIGQLGAKGQIDIKFTGIIKRAPKSKYFNNITVGADISLGKQIANPILCLGGLGHLLSGTNTDNPAPPKLG